MKIKYKTYSIAPCENSVGNFDLFEIITRTKKKDPDELADVKPETYQAEKELKYGMSLEGCLNVIVTRETIKGFKDDVTDIGNYLQKWNEQKDELKAYIENQKQIKIK